MADQLILILGGARSGKSRYATELASAAPGPVIFLATGSASDPEMADRIERHRHDRPADWQTIERTRHLSQAVRAAAGGSTIVLDSLGDLVTDYLLGAQPPIGELSPADLEAVETALNAEIDDLADAQRRAGVSLLVVSNEVGLGLVPPYPLGRHFRDLLGRANQRLASTADRVVFLMAGLPLHLKGDHG